MKLSVNEAVRLAPFYTSASLTSEQATLCVIA